MFKPVTTTAIDIKKSSEPHTGTYMGSDKIETKIGPQTIWNFADEDGLPFGVYGFTNLNRAMASIKVGSLCRITYKGTENVKTKFGMKDVHQVLVEIDSEEEAAATPDAKKEISEIPF